MTSEQKTALDNNAGGGPSNWNVKTASHIPLFFPTGLAAIGYHASFKACYDSTLKASMVQGGEDTESISTAIEFFAKLEADLDCSGACATPLFGVARAVADGPVTQDCVTVIIESLEDLLAPGIVCLLTFFVLLCACCGSIPICSGFDKEEEDGM